MAAILVVWRSKDTDNEFRATFASEYDNQIDAENKARQMESIGYSTLILNR
jgi:hypothetical protein